MGKEKIPQRTSWEKEKKKEKRRKRKKEKKINDDNKQR